MRLAQILTAWAGSGTALDPYRPLLLDLFTVQTCEDVTGQPSANLPPAPNAMVARVRCTQATLDDIATHSSFGPESILTNEPDA